MSNIGLDHPHIEQHFHENGLCQCPCSDCTTRLTKLCVCMDCPCECNPEVDHSTPPGGKADNSPA